MDKERGLRSKHGGIEIRAQINGEAYSWFLNKPWNPTNLAEARRIRKARIAEVKATAQDNSHLRKDNPLFQTVAQDYLTSLRKRATKSHVDGVRAGINNVWLPYLGLMPIKDIRVRDVRMADEDFTWSSAKRQQNLRSILRGVFNAAIRDEYIDSNPADKFIPVTHQKPAIDPFTLEEKQAILDQLEGQTLAYYTVAFETGLRTAELLGLNWADIRDGKLHLERTVVRGQLKSMKTLQTRSVVLSPLARETLDNLPRAIKGFVWFNHEGNMLLHTRPINKQWNKALKAAGVRYRRPYNCRHTRASLGLSAGQTPAWLAKQMGHDLRTFFARYADYLDTDNDANEMAKLEQLKPKAKTVPTKIK